MATLWIWGRRREASKNSCEGAPSIRLSFVECAYSDLRDIFVIILLAIEKDGTQLQNNNFGTF